jgi:hypothetical protein
MMMPYFREITLSIIYDCSFAQIDAYQIIIQLKNRPMIGRHKLEGAEVCSVQKSKCVLRTKAKNPSPAGWMFIMSVLESHAVS